MFGSFPRQEFPNFNNPQNMKLTTFLPSLLAIGDPSNMFGPVMKIIGQVAFALAFIGLILGGYKWMTHDHAEAKKALLAAAFMAAAGAIVTWLFRSQGMPVIDITP